MAISLLFGLAGHAALSETQPPLSVIDWLGTQQQTAIIQPAAIPGPEEPPVAQTALVPEVSVQPLGEGGPRLIGLVPTTVTGLPVDMWSGSDLDTLVQLLDDLPDLELPAAQALLYTVLLAEAAAPSNKTSAGDALALARVRTLFDRGALEPALSLIRQAGVTTSPAHFDMLMQISLLTGDEDRACAVLGANPYLTDDYATRIFCAARLRRWEDAALTFGSAQALGLMSKPQLDLFARFLDPEAFEGAAPLPLPREMDPLSFRLFETIGEPVPTSSLARPYAVADLRDLAGWKAQIAAAERLARAGALPDNHLLGLYTDRRAAASGSVWDRVASLQRFETALSTNSTEAVAKTLPIVWSAMQDAWLEVTFASLFADALGPLPLDGKAASIARDALLLSPKYETAAATMKDASLAVEIAKGALPSDRPTDVIQAAVYDAFAGADARADVLAMVPQGRLGEAILITLGALHDGARGKAHALTEALATLRALGLEDTARRAALQTLLLER